MRQVATSWAAIEAVLWENAHSAFLSLRRPATADQIARLERAVGHALPPALARSLGVHNGTRRLVRGVWMPLLGGSDLFTAAEIAREWRMRRGVHGDQPAEVDPAAPGDPRVRRDLWWRGGWLPVLGENGNYLVVDADPAPGGSPGQVFYFGNSSGPGGVIADSLAAWLDLLADELTARRFKLDEFGGIWLDRLDLTYGP